jgi:hypothetical protein
MKPRWWILGVMRDTRLSMDARGLLAFLGTQPAGWRYSVDECLRYTQWGRQKFQKHIREVKGAGYLETSYKRDASGRIIWTALTLKDKPFRKAEFQPSGKRTRKADLKAFGPRAEIQPRLLIDKNASERGLRVIGGRDIADDAHADGLGFAENGRAAK